MFICDTVIFCVNSFMLKADPMWRCFLTLTSNAVWWKMLCVEHSVKKVGSVKYTTLSGWKKDYIYKNNDFCFHRKIIIIKKSPKNQNKQKKNQTPKPKYIYRWKYSKRKTSINIKFCVSAVFYSQWLSNIVPGAFIGI